MHLKVSKAKPIIFILRIFLANNKVITKFRKLFMQAFTQKTIESTNLKF